MPNPYSAIGQTQDAPVQYGYDNHPLKPGEVDQSNPYTANYNPNHTQGNMDPLSTAYSTAAKVISSAFGGNNNGSDSSSDSSSPDPKLTVSPVVQFARSKGINLSAQDEMQLSQIASQQASDAQLKTQYQGLQQATGLANDVANAQSQRNLITNSQRYAAENTANQLNNLQQARNTTQVGISNAFNTAASMFR